MRQGRREGFGCAAALRVLVLAAALLSHQAAAEEPTPSRYPAGQESEQVVGSAADEYSVRTFSRDGRQLQLLLSKQFDAQMQANLVDWAQFIAAALTEVYGHWPRQHWQISVAPTSASSNDPIPWAQVHRGEVDSVEFFTSANASSAELENTWTGYHELAHLLIPYQGWGDAWFSEGLASYYQNVLQARAGVLSEQQMWQRLYDGFARGKAETRFNGQSLQTVSKQMRSNGGYMRVYWGGAWYFLAADTRLRLQSGGRRSLDNALRQLNDCCADQQLSARQIVNRLDELNRLALFSTLYDEVASSTEVLPFQDIFASMGIDIIEGAVHLQQEGPGARLRQQIAVGTSDRPGL
jgi:hypothetical protein